VLFYLCCPSSPTFQLHPRLAPMGWDRVSAFTSSWPRPVRSSTPSPPTPLMVSLECFVGHLDTETRGDTVARVTALAKATRDTFYSTIKSKFPNETFSGFQNLVQIANDGDVTTYALAWGVNEAFEKMKDPNYVFQDPPVLSKLSEAKTKWNVGQRPGNTLIAKDRTVQVPGASVILRPSGTYGKDGFTFNAPG